MTKTVIIICFLAAFAAGLTLGIETYESGAVSSEKKSGRCERGVCSELGLSAEQREQMKKIWSEPGRGGMRSWDERRQSARERDEAVAALIRPEDKARYDEIMKNHAERIAAMDSEWRTSFQTKVERTKEILTPEQRTKYEQMLERRKSERGSSEHHHGDREQNSGSHKGRTGTRPSTS